VEARFLERALELAEHGRGTTHPNPVVGAVAVVGDEIVGEGWHERKGGPHAEVVALEAAGERARGATLYVSMEPCAHHGTTPPCTEAVLRAGVAKVVAGSLDPNPEARGGLELLRAAGVEVEDADSFAARAQNEAWRTWVSLGRPFVVLKLAQTLDGRVAVPGTDGWISGPDSRRRVHELRAQVDAVAVGMGTARADDPQLTARDVGATRQPRRLVFGSGPSDLEVRSGALEEELRALAGEGVQSLLLEGGPKLATSFLREGLVDKLMLFVAPEIAGAGLTFAPELDDLVRLSHMTAEPVGDDVLLTAWVHEPSCTVRVATRASSSSRGAPSRATPTISIGISATSEATNSRSRSESSSAACRSSSTSMSGCFALSPRSSRPTCRWGCSNGCATWANSWGAS